MNRIFRVIKRKCDGLWIVVSEITKSARKGQVNALAVLAASLGLAVGKPVLADPTATLDAGMAGVASVQTTTNLSGGTVTQVNIKAPDANGLSHNQYTDFNVNASGLILNNTNNATSANNLNSALLSNLSDPNNPQLKAISANSHIGGGATANLILNEVTSANISALNGQLEVIGTRADVIIANPNGITCGGCGFINVDQALLTTGSPSVTGANINFDVATDASINIQAGTISADELTLIARQINLANNAKIEANEIAAISGSNSVDLNKASFTDSTVTEQTNNHAAISYGIDVASMGGMYANTIKIIATEDGIGVRSLGDINTTGDGGNITITADGDLTIGSTGGSATLSTNTVAPGSPASNVILTSTSGDIQITDATTAVSENITLTADNGTTTLSGGTLSVGEDLTITTQNLTDNTAGDHQRQIGGQANIQASGNVNIDNAEWNVSDSLTIASGNANKLDQINVGDNAVLQAGSGSALSTENLSIGGTVQAGASSNSNSTIDADALTITVNGTLTSSGNLSLQSDDLTVAQNSTLEAATSGSGSFDINLTQAYTNQETIQSGNDLSISSPGFVNEGDILAGGNITINTGANDFDNVVVRGANVSGRELGVEVDSGNPITEENQVVTSQGVIDAGGGLNITANNYLNESTVRADGNIQITANGDLLNQVNGGDTRSSVMRFDLEQSEFVTNYYEDQYFTAGRPDVAPVLESSAGTVTLTYGGNANNLGGAIRGTSVNDQGGGLIEDDLVTQRIYVEDPVIQQPTTLPDGTPAGTLSAIADGGTATTVELASNNASTVINIANPFANGMSYNTFTQLDINNAGLIFNNAHQGLITADTELSGVILANQSLGASANFILSEVNSTRESLFEGFAEIAGPQADLMIANPYGIVCNGCGFLNVDQLYLTSGNVNLNNNALSGLSVNQGALNFVGNGLNALGSNKTYLLGSVLNSSAPLNAVDLNIMLGQYDWQFSDHSASRNGNTAGFSLYIDTNGGLYANALSIESLGGGTIRTTGEMSADNGSLIISSDGDIIFRGQTSASNDLSVMTTSNSNGSDFAQGAIQIFNASISAGNDLTLESGAGRTSLAGGQLFANNDLSITAQDLGDVTTTFPAENNNERFSVGNTTLTISDDAQLTKTRWRSDQVMTLDGGANWVIAKDTLLAAQQATDITASSVINRGDIKFSSATGVDSDWAVTTLTNTQDGSIEGTGQLNITANTLNNSGRIQTRNGLDIDVEQLNMLSSAAALSGAMDGAGEFKLDVNSHFDNNGFLYSGNLLDFTFNSLTNTATGGIAANADASITTLGGDLLNYGALYSAGDLTLDTPAGATLANRITYHLQQGDPIGLGDNFSVIYEQTQILDSLATLYADGDITINAETFINTSEVKAGNDLTITADNIFNQIEGGDSRMLSFRLNSRDLTTIDKSTYFIFIFANRRVIENHLERWHQVEFFAEGAPATQPLMVAGNTLNWLDFNDARNLGGNIQAETVNISTAEAGATFLNDSLTLERIDSEYSFTYQTDFVALGPLTYFDDFTVAESTTTETSTLDSLGALVNAVNLNISGPAVTNNGPVYSTTLDAALNNIDGSDAPGDLNIVLPTNPNGYFVSNRDPSALFLVQLNPNLLPGISTLGSDYLSSQLDFNTDLNLRRLGDDGYEAYLVEQQLRDLTGLNVLAGYQNLADIMKGLMDNAVSAAGDLGLVYGEEPTKEQLAELDEPIVWMVETEVNGETVLAPKVFLPEAIMAEIDTKKAVLSADEVTMQVASLYNTGGDIQGGNLAITSIDDITNTSGDISGGNVSISSTEGNIINQTQVEYSGNEESNSQTNVGRQGGISATNDLSLDAAKDITNRGAVMNAGNNADLNAGGDITFDTIENRSSNGSSRASRNGSQDTITTKHSSSVEQIRSGLTVGGDLNTSSGGDQTFAGTDVEVGGNATIDSGGDVNIIARENSSQSSTTSKTKGMGVGGGVTGESSTESTTLSIRNQGSTFDVGGDVDVTAAGDMTLQGSEMNVGGDASIDVDSLNILAGRDLDETTTRSETSSLMGGDDSELEEGADGSSGEGVTWSQTTVKESGALSQRSKGSALNVGGNLDVDAEKDVTLQGSDINAQGDVSVDAENIRLLAAENREESYSKKTTTRTGLYGNSGAEGEAEAGTEAEAEGGGEVGGNTVASAEAGAEATAEAEAGGGASATVDVTRTQINTEYALDVTNQGSAIRSGGNTRLNAEKDLQLIGSEIDAAGDVDLAAENMSFEAAQDKSIRRSTSETTRVGLYAEAEGGAEASADAGAGAEAATGMDHSVSGGVEANASAEAGGKAGIGIQARNAKHTQSTGEINAITSAIRSGGNISRQAKQSITDVGTEIEAAGNLDQRAETINSFAARNESFSESTYEETTAKLGIYAEAEAGAEGTASAEAGASSHLTGSDAGAEASASGSAEAGARAGVEAMVDRLVARESERSTQAVTSNIKVGGSISSESSGSTVFEGTNIDAGENITIAANDLQIKAAEDTYEREASSEEINTRAAMSIGVGGSAEGSASASAGAEMDVGGSADAGGETEVETDAGGGVKVRGEASASYAKEQEKERSTTAVTSTFGGKNITIETAEKTTIEGAELNADEDINIDAGSLDFKAAKNTSESSSSSTSVDAELMVEATIIGSTGVEAEANAEVGVGSEQSSSTEAVTGSIGARNLNITTRDNTRLEGTQINTTDSATIDAGGDIEIAAAKNTEQSSSRETTVGVSIEASDAGLENGELEVGVGSESESSSEAVTAGINTGGNLTLRSGNDVTLEGTEISSEGDASVVAARDVNMKAARNTSQSSSNSVEVGVAASSTERSFEAEVGVSNESEQSDEAVTGSLSANNLIIASGRNASFEGTELEAQENAAIAAGGSVEFKAAESTSSSRSNEIGAGVSFGSEEEEDEESGESSSSSEAGLELGFEVSNENETIAQAGSLKAGNGVSVSSGKDMRFEGTELDAGNGIDLNAAGDVEFEAAESSSRSSSFGMGIETGVESETSTDEEGSETEREAGGKVTMAVGGSHSREQQDVSLNSGSGEVNVNSSAAIPGTDLTVPATRNSDGSQRALIPGASSLPRGASVNLSGPDGGTLPDWVSFDSASGSLNAKPPADFTGNLDVVVGVPQKDGSVKNIGVVVSAK